MNTKAILQVLLTPAIVLAINGQAQAQMFSYTDLGAGQANAINSAGLVVGDNLNGTAVLWDGTTETNLDKIGQSNVATGINSAGQMVGHFTCGCQTYAAQWNSVLSNPQELGGYGAANGINGAGQVVGYEYSSKTPGIDQAVIWNGGQVTTLATAGNFTSSVGTAINDQTQEVGFLSGGSTTGMNQAVLWNGSTATLLSGLSGNASTEALAINNKSQIAGYSSSNNITEAVLWNGTQSSALKSLGGTISEADGINNAGEVVGYSYTAGNTRQQAVLWDNGKVINLNKFLSAAEISAGWVLETATAINSSGTIVGDEINTITGKKDAFVLQTVSCVPEASSFAMWLAGLGMMAFTVRRRKAMVS